MTTIKDLFNDNKRATYFQLKDVALSKGLTMYEFSLLLANAIDDGTITNLEEKDLVFELK